MCDDEVRRSLGLILLVAEADVVLPTVRAIDEVESSPSDQHGTRSAETVIEYLGIGWRLPVHDPFVKDLTTDAQAVLAVGSRRGDKSVQRHRDVQHHISHASSSPIVRAVMGYDGRRRRKSSLQPRV